MRGPDKSKLYPNDKLKSVCYISNLPKRPDAEVGDYTYYGDNKNSPGLFYDHIEQHDEFLGDKLIIGFENTDRELISLVAILHD